MIVFSLNLLKSQSDTSQIDSTDIDALLDLDALWENTVWEEIQDVTTVYAEVEQITPVAGVRGAEAEDEALHHLYYRKSMKGLALLDLQKAYGKLIIKKEKLLEVDKNHPKLIKINNLIFQLKNKMKKV